MKRLYYDGSCPFCRSLAEWGRRWFPDKAIDWIAADYTDLTTLPIPIEAVIYQEGDKYWTKSEAIRQLLLRNGYPRLAWILSLCPRRWRDRLYDYVAKRRYCRLGDKCSTSH
ncbi:MAG: DUF393 domain-containing protein [Bacteroidia bacterium]